MEDALIVAIVFGFLFAALKLFFDYMKGRRESKMSAATAGNSLTESELKGLVRAAVEEVLDDRFGGLEKRLEEFTEPRLIPARQPEEDIEPSPSPPVAGDRESTR